MIRRRVPYVVSLAVLPSLLLAASPDSVFLAPRLEARVGYEDNRLRETGGGEGTPFYQAAAGGDVVRFAGATELLLSLDYRQTQFTRQDLGSTDEAAASAQWRHLGGYGESGASVGGGIYRDTALPEDDSRFWQVRPYVIRTLNRVPAELGMEVGYRATTYDSSGDDSTSGRTDHLVDLRPGLRWHTGQRATLWAELSAERNASDLSAAEYSGYGGDVGCDTLPTALLDVSLWAGMDQRAYEDPVADGDRDETRVRLGMWMTYRLRPWVEVFSFTDWESVDSSVDGGGFSWWRVGGGLRLVFDYEIAGH